MGQVARRFSKYFEFYRPLTAYFGLPGLALATVIILALRFHADFNRDDTGFRISQTYKGAIAKEVPLLTFHVGLP